MLRLVAARLAPSPRSVVAFALGSALVALCTLGFVGEAHALQCGQRLVVTGDRAHYVRSQCGAPNSVTTRTVTRRAAAATRVGTGGVVADSIEVTIVVETWVYDFGPRRFMEEIVLEDGIVVGSRRLGYGTAEGNAAREREVAPAPGS